MTNYAKVFSCHQSTMTFLNSLLEANDWTDVWQQEKMNAFNFNQKKIITKCNSLNRLPSNVPQMEHQLCDTVTV